MTRKDYELIARSIRESFFTAGKTSDSPVRHRVVSDLATNLKASDPDFDISWFIEACNPWPNPTRIGIEQLVLMDLTVTERGEENIYMRDGRGCRYVIKEDEVEYVRDLLTEIAEAS